MSVKKVSKQLRDGMQQGIYCIINPLVHLMIRMGVTPNMVTTIGLLGNLAAAVIICVAGYNCQNGGEVDYSLITIAGSLVIGFSLFDMLDGQVARIGGMVSRFGAMYDSVLDRYCELTALGAIAYYLIGAGHQVGAIITLAALVGSVMVSYVRARAEGLGIECKIGFMQRPERVVVTALSLLATGICGESGVHFDPDMILIGAMSVIAVFANLTVSARIGYCRNELKRADESAKSK